MTLNPKKANIKEILNWLSENKEEFDKQLEEKIEEQMLQGDEFCECGSVITDSGYCQKSLNALMNPPAVSDWASTIVYLDKEEGE